MKKLAQEELRLVIAIVFRDVVEKGTEKEMDLMKRAETQLNELVEEHFFGKKIATREVMKDLIKTVIKNCDAPHEDGEIFQGRYCQDKVEERLYRLTGVRIEK